MYELDRLPAKKRRALGCESGPSVAICDRLEWRVAGHGTERERRENYEKQSGGESATGWASAGNGGPL